MQKANLKVTVSPHIRVKSRRVQILLCADAHDKFNSWVQTQGFGGGMTEVVATAMMRRQDIRLCADISYKRRKDTKALGMVLPDTLVNDFEGWCWAKNVSMSSAIRGWIDNIDEIKAYVIRRSALTDLERYQAYENCIYNGEI